jgi:hypothetical protein
VLAALLLAGPAALALRILLLLARLGTTTLLLTGVLLPRVLLAWALVLLARVLALLLRHLGKTPLLDVSQK